MSGGVDSSVAAALLVEQGYDVAGIMLKLWSEDGGSRVNRCCTPAAVALARSVADHLGIPFYAPAQQGAGAGRAVPGDGALRSRAKFRWHLPVAARGRSKEGPVLRAERALAGATGARDVSTRRDDEAAGARPRPPRHPPRRRPAGRQGPPQGWGTRHAQRRRGDAGGAVSRRGEDPLHGSR